MQRYRCPCSSFGSSVDVFWNFQKETLHPSPQNWDSRTKEKLLAGLSRDHGVRHHKPVLWDRKGKCLEDSQTSNLLTSIGETSPPTQRTIADAEAFVCQLYHKGTREVEINKERAAAFCKVKKNIDSLPPTQDALHLHIRRANYQSMIWKRAKWLAHPFHALKMKTAGTSMTRESSNQSWWPRR